MVLTCLLIMIDLGIPTISHLKKYKLSIPFASTEPAVILSKDNQNLYYADFWDSVVYSENLQTGKIRKIAGKGRGPSEIIEPMRLVLMRNDDVLVIGMTASNGIKSFPLKKGTHQYPKVIKRFFPHNAIIRYDADHFFVFGGTIGSKYMFHIMNFEGKYTNSWLSQKEWNKEIGFQEPECGNGALAVCNSVVYYQDGAYPEVWAIHLLKQQKVRIQKWKFKFPKFYVPPPQKEPRVAFNTFNREKWESYYDSFTQLVKLNILDNSFLVVCYKHANAKGYSIDMYNIETKKRVLSNFFLKGKLISINDHILFSLERIPDDSPASDDRQYLHCYQISK